MPGLFRHVKCDETDYRALLLARQSICTPVPPPRPAPPRARRKRCSHPKFPREIFIRPPRAGTTVESLPRRKFKGEPEPANDVDLNLPVFIKLIKKKTPVPRRATCRPMLPSKHFGEIEFSTGITRVTLREIEIEIAPSHAASYPTPRNASYNLANAAVRFATGLSLASTHARFALIFY